MFPSAGLFADTKCPFTKRGFCERPHCFYKHGREQRDTGGSSREPAIIDLTGVQYDVCGATLNDDDAKDACLQQLERINRQIETVRHEVEQEQRRLSHYHTAQADTRNTFLGLSASKSETTYETKNIYRLSSCLKVKKPNPRARTYVVDNSKPKTDLEYDPLSNFSADLRSYSSSGREKDGQCLKRGRNTVNCDQRRTIDYQAPLSRSPSPDQLDDSLEDYQLIIDISPSGKDKDPVNSVIEKEREFKEVKALPIFLDSVKEFKATSPHAPKLEENTGHSDCGVDKKQSLSHLYKEKECGDSHINKNCIEFSKCLEGLGKASPNKPLHVTEAHMVKSPVPARSQPENQNLDLLEENICKSERSCVEKMNPLQPNDYQSKNSLFYKAPEVHPKLQHSYHVKPAQDMATEHWPSSKDFPTQMSQSWKTSNQVPAQIQGKASDNHHPKTYLEPVIPATGSSQALTQHNSSSSLTDEANLSSATTGQPSVRACSEDVIIIESSSDDEAEFNYLDIELSDSDPMEECYRIFMEANNQDKESEVQPDHSVGAMVVEKPSLNAPPLASEGKKRMAHETKHLQPAVKTRPQPQVLVPLRGPAVSGFAPQPSKIQQVQQRALILTASVKSGQAFVSSSCRRKIETQSAPSTSNQTPVNVQATADVQNAGRNYIPVGTTLINVGNNLQLIVPEGALPLPVDSSSNQVTSALTPITQLYTNPVTVRQTNNPPVLTPVQRHRTMAPLLIPAKACKPTLSSTSASVHSAPAASASQPAATSTVKQGSTKRKKRQQSEPPTEKVPHSIRQRYVNMFTEEFLKTSANVNEAFEKALAEENALYNRSTNKIKYQSVVVNALKKLKNQSAAASKGQTEVKTNKMRGKIPLNLKNFEGNDDLPFYESLKDYILTKEKLIENNYPVQHPEKPGCAAPFADQKKVKMDSLKRICCRCGATYSVSKTGKHVRREECIYHYGKGVTKRVPGGVETRYSCCEGVMGAPGCQVFQLHVHDALSLDGFVSTIPRKPSVRSCAGVYSLACEMCYTIHGLELSRVTVVNSHLQVIYDTFVRPESEVIDYDTRFSGISENDVKDNHTSLREVQEVLMSFIKADTILIGHGLEKDLCALKLLHGMVVDTSVVFPHRLGPPYKLTLNSLTAEYLRRIIQESVCGHDTAEDAAGCMELMLWKVKEDGKLKK